MNEVYISHRTDPIVAAYIQAKGYKITRIPPSDQVNSLVRDHPDIFMCRFFDGELLHAEKGELGHDYPQDIPFNAVCLEKYFIHNLKHTNARLMKRALEKGLAPVNVSQGYAKCSTCIVDGSSVITADPSIISALKPLGDIDILSIQPGHIVLEGADYGFIGGTCGRIGDELVFCGNLSAHPDYERIRGFIESKGLLIKFFDELPLTDIGSII